MCMVTAYAAHVIVVCLALCLKCVPANVCFSPVTIMFTCGLVVCMGREAILSPAVYVHVYMCMYVVQVDGSSLETNHLMRR